MPLLLPQALWVKRTALRLPDAETPWHGLVAAGEPLAPPLRLLLLGESTVSGVGVKQQTDGLAGQLAAQLATATGRAVQWQAVGRNGGDARLALQSLLPQVVGQQWDMALLVLGVNDTTHLTSRRRWRRCLQQLVSGLRGCADRVLVTAVPPLGHFSALPQPLRGWFGLRASLLDTDLRAVAVQQRADYLALDMPFKPAYLAADGFHPSAAGYRLWASGIIRQLGLSASSLGGEADASSSVGN